LIADVAINEKEEFGPELDEFKRLLADHDPDWLPDHRNEPLLNSAVKSVHYNHRVSAFVQALVDRGADVDLSWEDHLFKTHVSPLGLAMAYAASPKSKSAWYDTMRILVRAGADVDRAEREMRAVLDFEARKVADDVKRIKAECA